MVRVFLSVYFVDNIFMLPIGRVGSPDSHTFRKFREFLDRRDNVCMTGLDTSVSEAALNLVENQLHPARRTERVGVRLCECICVRVLSYGYVMCIAMRIGLPVALPDTCKADHVGQHNVYGTSPI